MPAVPHAAVGAHDALRQSAGAALLLLTQHAA